MMAHKSKKEELLSFRKRKSDDEENENLWDWQVLQKKYFYLRIYVVDSIGMSREKSKNSANKGSKCR